MTYCTCGHYSEAHHWRKSYYTIGQFEQCDIKGCDCQQFQQQYAPLPLLSASW
jgi:hypothetical protein